MCGTFVNARIVRQLLWFRVCQSFTKDHSLHLVRNGKISPILEVDTIKTNSLGGFASVRLYCEAFAPNGQAFQLRTHGRDQI
jgi:hypothetical protein